MKNIIITLFILSFLSCKAQTPVIDTYGPDNYGTVENAYYKDVQNFQDQYVGTWLYTNGTTSLKVVLVKKTMFYKTTSVKKYYADYLVGEYQYIENGVEKVNTLSNLEVNHTNIFNYNLVSITRIWKSAYPKCLDCAADERRLLMFLDEPSRRNIAGGISNEFILRRVVENNVIKLKVQFVYTGRGPFFTIGGAPVNVSGFTVPFGDYTLIKQ